MTNKIRQFDSGATRDTDVGKLDYEGFLSPLVLKRYAEYLHKHRIQSDGKLRDSDNWQKGIPIKEYMKSKARHFFTTWLWHRNKSIDIDIEDTLCAELFNTMGMLLELLKIKESFIEILKTGEDKKFVCPEGWKIEHLKINGWWVDHRYENLQEKYLRKDGKLHFCTGGGYYTDGYGYGTSPGYWPTKQEAEAALTTYLEKEKS